MKPVKFWNVEEARADQELLAHIIGSSRQGKAYLIPKETVVYSPNQVTILESAKLWYIEFKMYGMERGNCIVEVWENTGDDGHTDFQLMGYALVSVGDIGELCDTDGALAGHWGNIGEYDGRPYDERFVMGFTPFEGWRPNSNEFTQGGQRRTEFIGG